MFTNVIKKTQSLCSKYSILILSKGISVHHIIGSQLATFSLHQCAAPAIGAMHLGQLSIISAIHLLYLFSKGGSLLIVLRFSQLPTLCAASYMATIHKENNILHRAMSIIPAICACAFIIHPIGFHASAYALLWIIPFAISLIPHRSHFLHALASTFIAHAIGSVLWLYSTQISPDTWIKLIPVALLERFTLAAGITIFYKALCALQNTSHTHRIINKLRTYIPLHSYTS